MAKNRGNRSGLTPDGQTAFSLLVGNYAGSWFIDSAPAPLMWITPCFVDQFIMSGIGETEFFSRLHWLRSQTVPDWLDDFLATYVVPVDEMTKARVVQTENLNFYQIINYSREAGPDRHEFAHALLATTDPSSPVRPYRQVEP
jgi:hypothetical protein